MPDVLRLIEDGPDELRHAARARTEGEYRRRENGLDHEPIDGGRAAGSRVERRVDISVLRLRRTAVRFGIREVADHRMAAAFCHAARSLAVADQRGHRVSAAHERVENSGADVSRGAREKDSHRGRIS